MLCSDNRTVFVGRQVVFRPLSQTEHKLISPGLLQTLKDGTMLTYHLQRTSWHLTLNRQSMGVDVIWDNKFILCLRNSLSPNPSASCGHHTSQTCHGPFLERSQAQALSSLPGMALRVSPTQICSLRLSADPPQQGMGTKGREL